MQVIAGRTIMSRAEKAELLARLVRRYPQVGALITEDEQSLCRLLAALELADDEPVADYWVGMLTA